MGGLNEETLSGLRVHIKDDTIHLHDDTKNLKFEADLESFKKDVENTFKFLEKKEGLVEIDGTSTKLCLVKRHKKYTMFIPDETSIKQKLQNYLKAL